MVKQIIDRIMESEVLAQFDPGDKSDESLRNFLVHNADPLEKALGTHVIQAKGIDWQTKKYLSTRYPGTRWSILDHHPHRFGSWHEFILRGALSDDEIALSGDIMNVEGPLIRIKVHPERGVVEEPTTQTFLGI